MAKISRPVQLPSGRWCIRWLDATGKRRSETHAPHNDARAALARRQADSESVRIGELPAPPPPKTFDELCDHWMATRATQKRRVKYDDCRIRVHPNQSGQGQATATQAGTSGILPR